MFIPCRRNGKLVSKAFRNWKRKRKSCYRGSWPGNKSKACTWKLSDSHRLLTLLEKSTSISSAERAELRKQFDDITSSVMKLIKVDKAVLQRKSVEAAVRAIKANTQQASLLAPAESPTNKDATQAANQEVRSNCPLAGFGVYILL